MLYRNKQIKNSNRGIAKIFMPSLISMVACVISLLGTTFAWFTDSTYTTIPSMVSATYDLNIKIEDEEGRVEGDKVIYNLSQKKEGQGYIVTITAKESTSTGYCIINDSMITEQINQGETFTFTLYPDEDNKEYTFTSIWGTPSDYSKSIKIKNGDIVGVPLAENYIEDVDNTTNNNLNNNLSRPNVGNVDSGTSQPGEIETIIPSEGGSEVEEDNKITESDNSDTTGEPSEESDNSDTTEEPPEESETDTSN